MKNSIPDFQHISKILPQRYPFLMVDRVISVDETEIVALKNVTNNEPYFQGHFPGTPIVPGVLILESLIQTGGLYSAYLAEGSGEDCVAYIIAIDKVKFKQPVIPGDQLYLKVSAGSKLSTAWQFRGKAYVDDVIVAQATWVSMLTKEPPNKDIIC